MTELEFVRNAVEDQLMAWAESTEGVVEDPRLGRLLTPDEWKGVARASDSGVPDGGVRYQRCGGGRRIIRRQKGGD